MTWTYRPNPPPNHPLPLKKKKKKKMKFVKYQVNKIRNFEAKFKIDKMLSQILA